MLINSLNIIEVKNEIKNNFSFLNMHFVNFAEIVEDFKLLDKKNESTSVLRLLKLQSLLLS